MNLYEFKWMVKLLYELIWMIKLLYKFGFRTPSSSQLNYKWEEKNSSHYKINLKCKQKSIITFVAIVLQSCKCFSIEVNLHEQQQKLLWEDELHKDQPSKFWSPKRGYFKDDIFLDLLMVHTRQVLRAVKLFCKYLFYPRYLKEVLIA